MLHRTLVHVLAESTRPRRHVGQGPHSLLGVRRYGRKRRFHTIFPYKVLQTQMCSISLTYFKLCKPVSFSRIVTCKNGFAVSIHLLNVLHCINIIIAIWIVWQANMYFSLILCSNITGYRENKGEGLN